MPPAPPARRSGSPEEPDDPVPELVVAGRAFYAGKLQPVEIGIGASGRILRVARNVAGNERREYGDLVLVPAATDLHAHFREPGTGEVVETLGGGTLQAALGGVGLVGDMPNNEPPMDSVERVREKTAHARGHLAVDLVLYASAQPSSPIADLARLAGAFKLYLSPSTAMEAGPTAEEIRTVLDRVARTGLPLSVHAEDPGLFRPTPAPRTPEEWDLARPLESERRAVERLLPAPPSLRLHVAHVTEAALGARLRADGHSFEATPHHLLLSRRSGPDARWKVNPPLRADAVRSALWDEFRAGRIPCLASDHAPHSASAKELPFPRAPSGVPGIETMLPLLLEEARRGAVDLPVLLAAACDRPARWFGVPMGRLAVGHRADLLVIDFRARRPIVGRELHGSVGWSPFEGRTAVFPLHHLRAGVPIVEDGEYVGARSGEIVRPEYAPAAPEASAFRSARG
ncbi:MAG: dihydroorotase family protein [Thermoplasmata archaeon]|nr:dihydroorotase family protein [Thermoplasmata archaeon]MCI4354077.1 dihydroorotase family protein [Thermoplasmata archaeon]